MVVVGRWMLVKVVGCMIESRGAHTWYRHLVCDHCVFAMSVKSLVWVGYQGINTLHMHNIPVDCAVLSAFHFVLRAISDELTWT